MTIPASNAFSTNGQQFTSAASIAKYFKIRFAQGDLENHFAFGTPTKDAFGAFKADLTGEKTLMPMLLGTPQGIGANLASALRNAGASKVDTWTITTGALYAHISIDAKSMYGSRDSVGAYVNLKEQEAKLQVQNMGQEFEKQLWQDGTGSEGNLTVDPATGTSWSVGTQDIVNIVPGMKFLVYADSSGVPGAVRAGGPYEVASVAYQASTFETTAAANAAAAVGDHIVRDGSVPISGVNQLMVGVPAWIPTATPGSTLFFGVDRSVYPELLGGWRGTWKGSLEETIKTLHAQMSRLQSAQCSVWLSAANYNRFDIELGARAIREPGGQAKAGFAGVSIASAGKVLKLRTSPYIPDTQGWLLDDSTWELHSLGPVPHMINDDGMTFYRQRGGTDGASPTADSIACEWRAWPQLICRRPFSNGTFPVS